MKKDISKEITRITAGFAVGSSLGAAIGTVYGTYEVIGLFKVPCLLKFRYTALGGAAVFGLFLGAGSLKQCEKSY